MKEPYKILFIESGTSGGGSFESLYQYLKVIDKKKFIPIVVFLNKTKQFSLIEKLGVKVFLLNDFVYSRNYPVVQTKLIQKVISLRFFASYLEAFHIILVNIMHFRLIGQLNKIAIMYDIALVYLNGQINRDLFGIFLAKKTNLPCISHLRSMDGQSFGYRKASFANKYVDKYISNSLSTKKYWELKGVDSRKNVLVYNAVNDIPTKIVSVRKKFKIKNKIKYLIGCIGRLVPLKGHIFLIRSYVHFVKKYPFSNLIIIGDGPAKYDIKKEVARLGIVDKVIFTGYQPLARQMIGEMDFIVLPSQFESFGRVLIEAMQQKVPTIGTDLFGISEIIQDRYNGLLVPFGNEMALFQAMDTLISNKKLRSTLINNAYSSLKENFSMSRYKKEIESIMNEVLTKNDKIAEKK